MKHARSVAQMRPLLITVALSIGMIFVSPVLAYASGVAGTNLCSMIFEAMGGGMARAIATVSVLGVAINATLGHMDWKNAMRVAGSISAMYSTSFFIGGLTGNSLESCFG